MGAAAGLIPCPSALVVLLAAISQHEVALGLLLITAFSLGLAATLTGLGPGRRIRRQVDPAAPRGGAACGRSARGVGALDRRRRIVLTAKAVPGVV